MRRAAPWLVALLGAAALAAAWVLLLRETPPPAGVAHLPDSRSTDGPERPAALPGSPRVPLPGRDPGLPGAAAAGEGGLVVPALAGRLHGRVTDGQRVPLGGASVRVTPIDPESLRGAPFPDGLPIATVATAADGTFSVDAPEGVWLRVVAEAPDHAPAARVVTSRDAFVELALGPAGALVVEVVADDGKAVDDARVVALVDALRLEATTDARGEATFPALPPGTVFLRVEGSPTQVVEDGPVRVSHGETSRRLVVLPAAQSLEGVVVDDADGRPLAGAEVWLARPGRSIEAAPTDAEGRFGPLPAGSEAERQFVAVRADGYAPALEPVVLRGTVEGEPVGLEIRMRRAALWRGRVLDARGEPVEGAEVSYSADGVADRPMARATSDAGGWFTIEPPPPPAPGRRIVLHATAGGAQAALALRPLDPPPTPLELRLANDMAVGGRLVDRSGRPIAGAEVRVVPVWERALPAATPDPATSRIHLGNERGLAAWVGATDGDGRFLVAAVPPGTWQLHVRHGGMERWLPTPFAVGTRDVDLGTTVVDAGVTLTGVVRDAQGQPVAGARVDVRLRTDPPRALAVDTEADGTYRVPGLDVGTIDMRARLGDVPSAAAVVDLATDDRCDLVLPATGTLELDLVDEGDQPHGGIVVLRREVAGAGPPRPGRPQALRARAGRVRLDDVPAGAAWFSVTALDGRVGRTGAPLTIQAGQVTRQRLTLARPAVLQGVVRRPDGEPASVAEVHARHLEGRATYLATADLQGRWRFDDVVPGRYVVGTFGRGGAPVEREIEVPAGERVELPLDLDPAGSADVRVLDARGRSVAGALVRFRQAGRLVRARGPVRSDARGRALVQDLPVGFLELHVSHPEGGEARLEVQVQRDGPTPLTATLRRE